MEMEYDMNLYFVRHGQTIYNKLGCYYGSLDVPITKVGQSQAEKASEILSDVDFKKLYVSERSRTVQTADIILKDKKINTIVDKRLNETDFGKFEGKNYKELSKLFKNEFEAWNSDWKNTPPLGGESCIQTYSRVSSFMDDILKLNEDNVLIVCHGGVIRSVYCYVLNSIDFFWKFNSLNGDISIIKYEYDNLYIDTIMHV